jgi:hypothetical protein
MTRPRIEPVTPDTLPEFAEFLSRHLDSSRSSAQWVQGLSPAWMQDAPNHGFVLRDGDRIVGGIGALYASRPLHGGLERFCNITSWCVLDSHRQHSMRLAMAVVGQKGYHFTDFSPTRTVSSTLRFLKFKPLDDRQVVALNLPGRHRGVRLSIAPPRTEGARASALRQAYEDHWAHPWLRHVFLHDGQGCCHVIYKRRRLKGLPVAALLHASDPALLRRGWRRLAAHLLSRGLVGTLVEWRTLGAAPWPSRIRSGFVPKVFLSDSLDAGAIDYLYSELMVLDL